MLLSRRNQLLLEFSFWNEPLPRPGPNIYELRTYKLKVGARRLRGVWAPPGLASGTRLGNPRAPPAGAGSAGAWGAAEPRGFHSGRGEQREWVVLGIWPLTRRGFSSVSSQGP